MRLPYARPVLPGARFLRLVRRKRFFEAPLRISGVAAGRAYGLRGPCKGLLLAYGSKRTDFPFSPARKPTAIVSAQGARSGNLPLAASPARCRGESFLQATTGRAVAARALCPFPKKRYPGKAGKTANRAEYREKLRQAKIITPGRAGMQNAARPKRGARHFLPVFCSKHAPQAPVLGLPLSPLLPGEGGVLPSSYS